MRQEFDQSVPYVEQRLRVASAKEPGRKHQKRPGSRAIERRKASHKRAMALKSAKFRKLKAESLPTGAEIWTRIRRAER